MKVFKIVLTLLVMGLTAYSCTEPTKQETSQIDSVSTIPVDSTSECVDSCGLQADTAKK
jgi:hypothetical protein